MEALADLQSILKKIEQLRQEYGFRAISLVPDLAFIGLLDDSLDAVNAALDLLASPRPHRAYTMVRIAFEVSQRILPIATAEDYQRVGARAWLYYLSKDASLSPGPKNTIGAREKQIIELWAQHFPAASDIIESELEFVAKIHRPDNFMARNLAEVARECYEKLADEFGGTVPPNNAEVNRSMNSLLSRESHAVLRLEPVQLRVDSDGYVEVKDIQRDPSDLTSAVVGGAWVTLREVQAAVEYRSRKRRIEHAAKLLESVSPGPSSTPPEYVGDFGKHLLEQGLGHTQAVFPHIHIFKIRELPDGTLSSSVTSMGGEEPLMATFDFKGSSRGQLLEVVTQKHPEILPLPDPIEINLPDPIRVTIKANLGVEQLTVNEKFIPLIVIEVTSD